MKNWLLAVLKEIIVLLIVASIYYVATSYSEEYETYDGYVICQPDDYINVRTRASRKSSVLARLDAGDVVHLDGKEKNSFLHCVDLSAEMTEGWIHKGYIVYDEPIRMNCLATVVSKGRLAARKYVDGKRIRWLKPMSTLRVYYLSDYWAVTNKGFIKTEFLELGE